VRSVRRAITVHGCRLVYEIVEETGLSRWAVDKVLKKLMDEGVVEARDGFAEEAGRPPVEYYPAGSTRDEDVADWLRCAADLL